MTALPGTAMSRVPEANDVLPACTGRISAMTPPPNSEADYGLVIAAVQAINAKYGFAIP